MLREISRVLTQVLKDPRTEGVTLTGTDVSPDLRNVRVYFSVLGSAEAKREALRGLESARGLIKRELGRHVKLRYMPEISFVHDDSMEHAERIQELLREIDTSSP